MSEKKGELVKIGALWAMAGGKGFSGRLGDARLLVFPNNFKESDKHPDYVLYVTKDDKPAGGGSSSAPRNNNRDAENW